MGVNTDSTNVITDELAVSNVSSCVVTLKRDLVRRNNARMIVVTMRTMNEEITEILENKGKNSHPRYDEDIRTYRWRFTIIPLPRVLWLEPSTPLPPKAVLPNLPFPGMTVFLKE